MGGVVFRFTWFSFVFFFLLFVSVFSGLQMIKIEGLRMLQTALEAGWCPSLIVTTEYEVRVDI